jgi:NAD(P)-dependent dehydrogenase (short-subunit alcohol dehydrogenase family)
MANDLFGYDDKRVLVVGGATGMGAAAAQIAQRRGASIVVLDVADVTYPCQRTFRVDLADKASVDAVLAQLDGSFDSVFSCAGVADGSASLMKINFISQRYIIDTLFGDGRLADGGAVAMISSVGGLGWQAHLPPLLDFLAENTWERMERWVAEHDRTNNYVFSKQAMNAYVASRAFQFAKRRMRINAIMPGGTDTPLARKHADTWLPFQADYRDATGLPRLTPEKMGSVLAFLCTEAAAGVNGTLIQIDDGYVASGITGSFESPTVTMLAGS